MSEQASNAGDREPDNSAKITEAGVSKLRGWIGKPGKGREGRNTVATADNIRHWAYGVGDDNPLFCDEDYARQTRWGGVIAPPTFEQTFGQIDTTGLPGVHALYAGDDWEFFQPVCLNDRITFSGGVSDIRELSSQLAGRTIEQVMRTEYENEKGERVSVRYQYVRRFERDTARRREKYMGAERYHYRPEEIKQIEADYDTEQRRGPIPRYWDDVQVDESLGHVVKGPLTVTDIVAYYMGQRPTAHVWAHRLFLNYRREHPLVATLDEYGVPDTIERVHYDNSMSRAAGVGIAYDFGDQRAAWLVHLLTNWMGDDGFLRKLSVRNWRPNYIGDTSYFRGRVVSKEQKDGMALVQCEVWGESQRWRHATATATIELPMKPQSR